MENYALPKTGTLGKCTRQETEILGDFRFWIKKSYSKARPQLWDDWFLQRFCRAREFKLDQMKIMFDNYVKFCQEYDMENIHKTEKNNEKWRKIWEDNNYSGHFGVTKEGMPYYTEVKKYWIAEKLIEIPLRQWEEIFIKGMEDKLRVLFPMASKLAGRRIDRFVVIFDLKDAPLKIYLDKKLREKLMRLNSLSLDMYPEVMAKILQINVPFFFYAIWNATKLFLPSETKKKISLEKEGKSTQEVLYKHIEKDQLPIFLGGNIEVNKPDKNSMFTPYLDVCNEMGTFYPEPGVHEPENNIFAPQDPWKRAQTMNLEIGKTIFAKDLRNNKLNTEIVCQKPIKVNGTWGEFEENLTELTEGFESPDEHFIYPQKFGHKANKPSVSQCCLESKNPKLFNTGSAMENSRNKYKFSGSNDFSFLNSIKKQVNDIEEEERRYFERSSSRKLRF